MVNFSRAPKLYYPRIPRTSHLFYGCADLFHTPWAHVAAHPKEYLVRQNAINAVLTAAPSGEAASSKGVAEVRRPEAQLPS